MKDLYYINLLSVEYDIDMDDFYIDLAEERGGYTFFSSFYKGTWKGYYINDLIILKLFYRKLLNSLFFKSFRSFSFPYRFEININNNIHDGIVLSYDIGLSLICENCPNIFLIFPVNYEYKIGGKINLIIANDKYNDIDIGSKSYPKATLIKIKD